MRRLLAVLAMAFALPAAAAEYPKLQEGDGVARDFTFHTGETLPALKLHDTTIGDPGNPAVLTAPAAGNATVYTKAPAAFPQDLPAVRRGLP